MGDGEQQDEEGPESEGGKVRVGCPSGPTGAATEKTESSQKEQ